MDYTTNYSLRKPGLTDNYSVEDFNHNADVIDGVMKDNENAIAYHKAAAVLDHPDGSVTTAKLADGAVTSAKLASGAATDGVIGNRTINDTTAPSGDTGTITTLFGWLANMIKAITGKSNWRTAPATTLEAAKSHMDATTGVHGATSAAAPNTIVQRDANGRIKAAAPSASDDVARKAEVDATISGKEIPGNNANNAIKTGYYYFNPSTVNGPGFQYGIIHTMVSHGDTHNGTNNWVFQVAYTTGYNAIKTRRKINADPWSEWTMVWTADSDGAGSGLDADLLDGMQPSTSATANTIVQRDSSGRIKAAAPSASDDVARKAEIDTRLQNNISFRINSGVVEYYNGSGWVPVAGLKSIQRGTASLTNHKTTSVTISPVNPSKAFVNLNVFGSPGSSNYISLRLENSTTLIFTQEGSAAVTPSIEWEVVEFY